MWGMAGVDEADKLDREQAAQGPAALGRDCCGRTGARRSSRRC